MRRQKNVLRKGMHNRVNGFTINIDFCGKDKQTFQHRMHRLERLTVTFQNSILHFEFTFPTPLVKTPINWLQSYNGKKLRLCLEVILLYPRVQYNSKQNMASFFRLSTVNMLVIWAKEKNNCTQFFRTYIHLACNIICMLVFLQCCSKELVKKQENMLIH